MSIADLSDPRAVLRAIDECDRLGREVFLTTYGFGPARKYLLLRSGKKYDSKAIAGVAYGYQFPQHGPLSAKGFSGGVSKGAAASRLRELGFEVDGA